VFVGHHAAADRALRAGAVKARSAAERGGGAKRGGLDGAEHSVTLECVMAAADRLRQYVSTVPRRLSCSYRQVIVLAQRRLTEFAEESIQAVQRHG